MQDATLQVRLASVTDRRLVLGIKPLVYGSVLLKFCNVFFVAIIYEVLELVPWQVANENEEYILQCLGCQNNTSVTSTWYMVHSQFLTNKIC